MPLLIAALLQSKTCAEFRDMLGESSMISVCRGAPRCQVLREIAYQTTFSRLAGNPVQVLVLASKKHVNATRVRITATVSDLERSSVREMGDCIVDGNTKLARNGLVGKGSRRGKRAASERRHGDEKSLVFLSC
jgi:hypothetical protein